MSVWSRRVFSMPNTSRHPLLLKKGNPKRKLLTVVQISGAKYIAIGRLLEVTAGDMILAEIDEQKKTVTLTRFSDQNLQ